MKTDITDIQAAPLRMPVASERVFTRLDWLVFSFLSLLRTGALAWFLWHWFIPVGWWAGEKLSFVGATLLLILGLGGNHLRWISLPHMKRPIMKKPQPHLRAAAVTTCVPSVEPPELIERSLTALVALDYPHDTWLLDEGGSLEMQELCRSLGARHFSRAGMSQYQCESGPFAARTKHGNYNAWLREYGFDHYEFMLTFDPDQIPAPEYASSVLGFFDDESVAYVQTPQVYRNQNRSFVARGAAEETYSYYSVTEMASFAAGAPVLTGCHNAQRLSALKEYGGLPDHAAEDLLQTVYYRLRGWRGVYVPKVLATGMAPEGWNGYLNQQIRWARSVFDIKFRRLSGGVGSISLQSGIEFLQGFGYLQDAIIAAGALTLFIMMLAAGHGKSTVERLVSPSFGVLLLVIFATDAYRQSFYLQPGTEAGFHWRAGVLRAAKWPFVWKALWLVFLNRPFRYIVTPKTSPTQSSRRLLVPHATVAATVMAAWAIGARQAIAQPWSLQVCAAAIIALSIGMIAHETMSGPGRH